MKKSGVGKGISIAVKDNQGNLLTPDQSGCLGRLKTGKYLLRVEFDRTERVRGDFFGLERQGPVHAILKKDYRVKAAGKIFWRTLEVYGAYKGVECRPYVAYPDNHFKLLELYKNGSFKVWEVGITMRGQKFYLVAQVVWNERAYRDGETVVIPALSDWLSLRKVMFMTEAERLVFEECRRASVSQPGQGKKRNGQKKAGGGNGFVAIVPPDHQNLLQLKDLEHISKYVPRPEITADGLGENQGKIDWWNDCHGIGGIATLSGPARIHRNNLVPPDEFISFDRGEVVVYDQLIKTTDQRSKFPHEAIGVRLA